MATKKRGLGRGLDALLGGASVSAMQEEAAKVDTRELQHLPLELIQRGKYQPRRDMDPQALEELAQSIKNHGVMQPIVVRPLSGGRYEIIAGERRWRASQQAGLDKVPALVREVPDEAAIAMALIENIQREDLNPIEEAEAYRKLIGDFQHTQDALGRIVGKSRSHIANLMRLLDLPASVQQQVMEQKISMGHARALIGVPDCETLARRVEDKGLSVRDTEQLVRRMKTGDDTPAARRTGAAAEPDADIASLEQPLADILGLKVDIRHEGNGGGTLTLRYSTLDQLDMLCQRLSGERI